jgi:hypothetical protein
MFSRSSITVRQRSICAFIPNNALVYFVTQLKLSQPEVHSRFLWPSIAGCTGIPGYVQVPDGFSENADEAGHCL